MFVLRRLPLSEQLPGSVRLYLFTNIQLNVLDERIYVTFVS